MTDRIGIDLGGTKVEGVRMDRHREIVARLRRPTPVDDGYGAVVAAICELVRQLEGSQTLSVGIGTPGTTSALTGRMKNCNSTSLNGQPLREDLQAHLGREVRMMNDANCFALSEALDGAAVGHEVVFGVILGTGVGGGVVLSGRCHDGPNRIAGEWGHTPLVHSTDALPCYCGRSGCVETVLSGTGITAAYGRAGGDSADARTVVKRAESGEAMAASVMDAYMEHFGRAMATVIDILDPDIIVLGGGVSSVQRLYQDGPSAVARHLFSDEMRTPIVPNVHGGSSGVRGAAMLWPA